MKRPNGTGTIVKLSGNRRKPYAVRIPSRNKYGSVVQNTLSYHATSKDAQAALDCYNSEKAAGTAVATDRLSITVKEVYEIWSARKFARAGAASIASYKASWLRFSPLYRLKMREVTLDHLQAIIDQDEATGLSQSSINNDKALMKALYKCAMERDIVGKDYSAFVQTPNVDAKHEKGAFTDLQMNALEQMAAEQFPWADTALILCYTGFRITELLTLTRFSYHLDGRYLTGGVKTKAGKNRVVPVHPKIQPYLDTWLLKQGDTIICNEHGCPIHSNYYRDVFKAVAAALGVPQATPHWCRHTFASRLHAAGAPELDCKRLLGHADKDVTEHYTHTDIEQLSAAIRLLA